MKQLSDFDLTVVVAYARWGADTERVFLQNAAYYGRNGIEAIVLVEDAALKEPVLEAVRRLPFVCWKVWINEKGGSPADKAASLETGIRLASRRYVMVLEPDLAFQTDAVYLLREKLNFYPGHYAVAQILGEEGGRGCVMACKESLMQEKYPEALARLSRLYFPEAVLIRQKPESDPPASAPDRPGKAGVYALGFDWKENPYTGEQCRDYLSAFKQFECLSEEIFRRTYRLVALIPVYNESERMAACLKNVESYCDGIVLLDDDSPDDTYRLARSEKLLIKAQKVRHHFNDKENRNLLLDIASFIRAEWFVFIDADERFDARFFDLTSVFSLPVDSVGVWIANLWERADCYRTDLEDSHPYSKRGLWFRWRMFRNRGRMQIICPDSLHFTTVPALNRERSRISKTVLLHLGYLEQSQRHHKYSFYKKEDTNEIMDYEYILQSEYTLARVEDIEITF